MAHQNICLTEMKRYVFQTYQERVYRSIGTRETHTPTDHTAIFFHIDFPPRPDSPLSLKICLWRFEVTQLLKYLELLVQRATKTSSSGVLFSILRHQYIYRMLETTLWLWILMLTLVEVGECFIMQFNSRRGSCTQNILKWKDLVLTVWRQIWLLLLEDGECKHIAGEQERQEKNAFY